MRADEDGRPSRTATLARAFLAGEQGVAGVGRENDLAFEASIDEPVSMSQLSELASRALDIYRSDGAASLLGATTDFLARSAWDWSRGPVYRMRYGRAAPRPYDLLSVDPGRIRYCTCPPFHCSSPRIDLDDAYVEGGDWDRTRRDERVFVRDSGERSVAKLADWVFYRSMLDHFVDDVPWEDTDWYQWVESRGGVGTVKYKDVETMDRRLAETDALYRFVERHGYKTQAALAEWPRAPFEVTREPCPEHHEIVVDVGRDGELVFEEGRHRLAVAKALDLDCVPVRVLVRHERWQDLRHQVATATDRSALGDEAKRHLDHPDVRPLLSADIGDVPTDDRR